ncbi:MAG: deoxyguanosinetriphosphate triphosphohydrolase [Desulfuromonadales bacterium]|nr:deoxyguanosinetriphosphate triphosphohydrolase [Desulfuromonadales bacterium]
MDIRQATENFEREHLAPAAACSSLSRGREGDEVPCQVRTAYQVDRDRILHCKTFRRLKYKTQVFLSPEGDHYRTRLTHTLEVSQIARTLARALRLNEDLTEAIALGHDLGHTPFGHAGERVLNDLLPAGFHHVRQSLRVVEHLEKDGQGLNLTWEVRDGISRHSKGLGTLLGVAADCLPATLEGRVVRLADVIAYVNHDLDDAIRAGLVAATDLPLTLRSLLGETHAQRINTMVCDLIEHSRVVEAPLITLSADIAGGIEELRGWLYEHVYRAAPVDDEFCKASRILRELFDYFMNAPESLGKFGFRPQSTDDVSTLVADFLAGMTDRYALNLYQRLFLPQRWKAI